MPRLLLSWVGQVDLNAPAASSRAELGPIARTAEARPFDELHLLCNYPAAQARAYVKWLQARTAARVGLTVVRLGSPTDFGEIYAAAAAACDQARGKRRDANLSFLLSPGTPAMAAVWILLSKARVTAELLESSREQGVRTVALPFEISAEFVPDLIKAQDARLARLAESSPPEAPEFADIVHRSKAVARIVDRARRVAPRGVPVLIEGESGTGKELLARAIHRASPRRERAFVAVNCGAIPAELVESELFGHEKGAFTGAVERKAGVFEAANGGTLFLDEVGELPGAAQVKLLRVLQDGEVTRVGSTTLRAVDVRVIAATNRTLTEEIVAGRFRSDLFYRLAVAVLKLPPLRERPGDLGLLIDHLLGQVNQESQNEPGYVEKGLSVGARALLMQHDWPGNVRELLNTLRRAAIWSGGPNISAEDVRDALLPIGRQAAGVLDRPLGSGLVLPDLMAEVATHYLRRAMEEAGGNKTRAAELVGLPSYQTLSNWLRRHGVK